MFYSPPLCGISANTEFTIFQPQTQRAAIFKSSKECARYYHLPSNTKNQKEAETKKRPYWSGYWSPESLSQNAKC